MQIKWIWKFVFISILHLVVSILAGAINWNWQTVIVSAVSAICIWVAYFKIVRKIAIAGLVVVPFFLLYVVLSIGVKNPLNYPVWFCGIAVSLLAIWVLKLRPKPAYTLGMLAFICLLEYFIIYPNYFSYHTMKHDLDKYDLSHSKIVDVNESEVGKNNFKGRVVLFDVWHSACYWCIKEFPELQKLYNYYKSDSSVKIVSLNFPIGRDNGIRPTKFTANYSFEKMFFQSEAEYEKFSDEPVPLILIMDKNFICRYAGQLNTDWNIFIGNAKRIINKLKNE